jgi:hypothetical protein
MSLGVQFAGQGFEVRGTTRRLGVGDAKKSLYESVSPCLLFGFFGCGVGESFG